VKQSSQTLVRKPRSGISIVPFVGDLLRMTRLVRDPSAHWGYKMLVLLAIAYVVSPVDAVPEALVPMLGFFDDVGLVVGLRLLLERQLAKYRYPLFAEPPSAADPRIQVRDAVGSAG
jgi:uncharacterized membrane protein YkvA (DUF1232 family)